ncbi:MAG: VWA domain-containing protein [bacterium]|nr:VWA domain-containing protein [bacterium]
MRNHIPSRLLSIACLLLLPLPAGASEEVPVSEFVEQVDVNVVNVEVFVTDRDGRRVTDLTQEDFEVYEDGRPMEISNFYAVARGLDEVGKPAAAPAETAAPSPAQEQEEVPEDQRLHLVVYVDNFNLRPANRAKVLSVLPGFLENRVAEGDRVMLLAYSGALGMVQPFTEDLGLITAGIENIGRSTTHLPEADFRRRASLRRINQALTDGDAHGAQGHLASYIQQARADVQRSVQALESTVRALGVVIGRKAILYVSDGLETTPGQDLADMYPDLYTAGSERHRIESITREANAHQVTFYTLDARGTGGSTQSAAFTATEAGGDNRTVLETNRNFHLQETLLAMAEPTGGSAILNAGSFEDTLDRVGQDFDSFYSLGYPSRGTGKGVYHKIEVKLRRPGLKVRHRKGYFDKPAAERFVDHALSSLILDHVKNPLEVELEFGEPEKKGRNKFLLPILVRIPHKGVTFLPRDEMMEARLRILLVVQDEDGGVSSVEDLPYPVTVTREEEAQAPGEEHIGYQKKLKIGTGTQKVAVGILDQLSGTESFVHDTVVLGKSKKSKKGG